MFRLNGWKPDCTSIRRLGFLAVFLAIATTLWEAGCWLSSQHSRTASTSQWIALFCVMLCNIVLRQTFLPLDSVKLGRLVLNIDEPQQDYLDPVCDHEPEITVKSQTNYTEVQHTASDRNLASFLACLVSASRTKRRNIFTQVTTNQATTYQLRNSGLWFQSAAKSEPTRIWIEQAIDQGDDVYVVVGYHTLLDARIVEGAAATSEIRAQIEVPVTVPLPGAAAVIAIGNSGDPGIAGHQQRTQCVQREFVADGEQICAVQYRKVCFKWFSSRNMGNAELKGNRWKVYWDIRGMESGTNDVLEADLQDELDLGNECEYEKYTSETQGDFLV